MIPEAKTVDLIASLWREAKLDQLDSKPTIEGIDRRLRRLELRIGNVRVLQAPEVRNFVKGVLAQSSYKQVRFTLEMKFAAESTAAADRTGLEEEITELLGSHWHGGHFGVLEDGEVGDCPVVWVYGLSLANADLLTQLSERFERRNIQRAALIIDLDQLALDRNF
jgi:hypothetical protein